MCSIWITMSYRNVLSIYLLEHEITRGELEMMSDDGCTLLETSSAKRKNWEIKN